METWQGFCGFMRFKPKKEKSKWFPFDTLIGRIRYIGNRGFQTKGECQTFCEHLHSLDWYKKCKWHEKAVVI